MSINTRSEIINALREAAELEHGLLCQYLFAALTLKNSAADGLSLRQIELLRGWKGDLLWVALEEMAHLGTVCNLLSAVGAAPHFQIPSFPIANKYFPSEEGRFLPFRLTPISQQIDNPRETLHRFIGFESPDAEQQDLANAFLQPDELEYTTIGDLYQQILEAMLAIPEAELFIGPRVAQESDDWNALLRISKVSSHASAKAAIDAIVEDGEGGTRPSAESHYATFVAMNRQWDEVEDRLGEPFHPSRNVVADPSTDPDADDHRRLSHEVALQLAIAFNDIYTTALILLTRYFTFLGGRLEQETVRAMIRQLMSGVMRPLGEIVSSLPARPDGDQNAAPTFQAYTAPHIHANDATVAAIITERLYDTSRYLESIVERDDLPEEYRPRLKAVYQDFRVLTDNYDRLRGKFHA